MFAPGRLKLIDWSQEAFLMAIAAKQGWIYYLAPDAPNKVNNEEKKYF